MSSDGARPATRTRWLAVVGIGFAVVALRVALLPVLGVPRPQGHDEFSYLLAADTFAHGRVTNPTHPMWQHFETFHVIHQPTYASIYPPAQGLVLAAGQRLGSAWIGQLLATGLMCAAFCWMLQGWLPPRWALWGAAVAALRIGVLSYWMNGYWSASVVAIGGALLLGALPRLQRPPPDEPRALDALLLAAGIAILLNTRPYEGAILTMLVAVALLFGIGADRRPPAAIALRRIAIPAGAVLAVAALATGYYYWRVTGSPFRMAYQVDLGTNNPVPAMLWQAPLPEPAYRHETLRKFYELDLAQHAEHRTLVGFFYYLAYRLQGLWGFYLRGMLAIPLLALPWVIRDRRMRFPLIAGGVFMLALMAETWALPHYAAPAAGLLFLIIAECARRFAGWQWRGRPLGLITIQLIPLLLAAELVMSVAAAATHSPSERRWPRGNLERASVVEKLEKLPGKQLVIVDYAPDHDLDYEWVFNAADIDASKVVWARDMGAARNRELLQYFNDRQVWTIHVDDRAPPTLVPNSPD